MSNSLSTLHKSISMSSLEISKLMNKRHDHVIRDIEAQLSNVCNLPKFGEIKKDGRNRDQKYYNLPRREVLILVSGYRVELRARIIDRLEELETEASTPALSTSIGYEQRGDGIYYRYDPKSNYFYNYRLSEAAIINAIITKISRLASVLEKKEWRGEMAYAEVKHHDTGETLYHPQAVERVCLLFDLDYILGLRQF